MASYTAVFDAGTTAIKGALVDTEGRIVFSRSAELETLCSGSFHEQEPEMWWQAFCAVFQALANAFSPADISGIIMSGQMQDLILLDTALKPVCPAILYSDGRAAAQAERLADAVGAEQFAAVTGNRCDGSLPLPKLMWVKEERPALFAGTAHVLISSKDYLIARLTGVCAGDVTACATAGAMDIVRKCWSDRLLRAAGVDEALFPQLFQPGQPVGAVLEDAQAQCGCPASVPVYAGIGDAGATTLASGIRWPGQYNINLGTSGWIAAVSDAVLADEAGVFNLAAADPGAYINVVPFLNAGNVHKWISGILGGSGVSGYDAVERLLETSVPGSHGLLCLPYLSGERFPVLDAAARGCFWGMTAETSASDLARACLEGVAFSLRQGLERLPVPPKSISLIGGGGRSAVWCQILADVLGYPITVLEDTEFRAARALAELIHPRQETIPDEGTVYLPRQENRTLYARAYSRYGRLYPALREMELS